jgi:hypothetical protein
VLGTGLQTQRLKHRRTFAFSAIGRKIKPPAMRVVIDIKESFIITARNIASIANP